MVWMSAISMSIYNSISIFFFLRKIYIHLAGARSAHAATPEEEVGNQSVDLFWFFGL